ncbi:MAG TPA: VIT domain-containing protein, partial [Anaerolineae bacterium]
MRRRLLWFALTFAAALAGLLWAALPAAADGIIIPRPPIGRPPIPWRNIPISVKYHHVDVTIKDQVATTHVDQVFVNQAGFAVEGTYMFPLPEDAAISSFEMTVDGQKFEGKLLGRDEARAIYEEIVRSQRDPALLEYAGRGAFQARIFPIPPNGERRIELSYTQVLQQTGGLVRYRYPLNTEKFSAQALRDVAVTVHIEDRSPLRAIYSPSHAITVTRNGDRQATATYTAQNVRPDTDFDLYYSLSPDAIAVNLLSYKNTGEDGFFLLLVTPPVQTTDRTPVAKDVVLVLDTSGSMEGKKLDQVKTAAAYVLDHLN